MPPEHTITASTPLRTLMHSSLSGRGFVRDSRVYRKDDLAVTISRQWLVFTDENRELASSPADWGMGQPGLWKRVGNAITAYRVFEVPIWVVSEQPEDDRLDESGPATLDKLVDWALETRLGRIPRGWTEPDVKLVQSWMARDALTVQAKGCVRQGDLVLRPGCWAIRIPILPSLDGDLPGPRRRALEELVLEARRHWAMVRLGVSAGPSSTALVAEVDLCGAPHSELLFSAGVDVLRHVVAWLVETADVLADRSVVIQCLAPGENNTTNPNERNTP